ncbi:MAG: hypothetical protein M3N08_02075 [Pseudomonadota bacterium]|nr:hypothetical protein [Pseudomonadota bacterium]
MPLPHHVFAPAFRHRRLGWFFTLLVGIMVYLASFATAAEMGLFAVTFTWDKHMESRMTIEIPAVDDESSTAQPDRVAAVLNVLRNRPEVERAAAVPEEDTARLLAPWIGQADLLKALPIPTLVDLERRDGSTLTAAELETSVQKAVSDARVDDHAAWMSDLSHLVRWMAALGAFIILLTGVTLVTTVSLLCRAIMATEHETISLLHVMGAEDNDIARHFQFHARRMAWPASLVGFAMAGLSVGLLTLFVRRFADLSFLPVTHWIALGAAVCLVPLVATIIAALSARHSVLRLLLGVPWHGAP